MCTRRLICLRVMILHLLTHRWPSLDVHQAIDLLTRSDLASAYAQVALPGCALLRFARADMEEGSGNLEGAQQVRVGVCVLMHRRRGQGTWKARCRCV
jgi:hypothetical protein